MIWAFKRWLRGTQPTATSVAVLRNSLPALKKGKWKLSANWAPQIAFPRKQLGEPKRVKGIVCLSLLLPNLSDRWKPSSCRGYSWSRHSGRVWILFPSDAHCALCYPFFCCFQNSLGREVPKQEGRTCVFEWRVLSYLDNSMFNISLLLVLL